MNDLLLSFRLAWRGVRAGEYRVLLAALMLAVACATLLGVVGERMQGALDHEAARISGGDLVISGRQPADPALGQWLTQEQLRWSQRVELTSMAGLDDTFLLISLSAVDDTYPLIGQLRIAFPDGQEHRVRRQPPVGEVWLEPGLALRLDAKPGDWIEIGDRELLFSALLLETPDQSGGFASFSPRALVHLDSLEGSALLGPLSRARWRLGMTGDAAALARVRAELPARLENHQRLRDMEESQPGIARAMNEGRRYLGMAGLIAVLLAALAVALASQRQARRQAREVALLRCLGQSRARVQRLFLLQLLWLGVAGGLVGGAAGYLAHLGLVQLLAPLLPLTLPPPTFWPMLAALLLAIWLLLGFSLAPLLSLARVSPLAVLQSRPWQLSSSAWLTYGLAALSTLGLGIWLSRDLLLTLWTLLGLLLAGVLVALLGWMLLRLLMRRIELFPWRWRQGLRRLGRNSGETLLQLSTFTLAFAAVLLVARGGDQLVGDWQQQLPEQRPNQFAVDIQPHERQDFEQFLDQAGLQHSRLYPILRGRLLLINGEEAETQVPEAARNDNTLRRELNLTWSSELPEGNRVMAGRWWQDGDSDVDSVDAVMPVSVESGMARRLGLELGDRMTFNLAGSAIETRIISLREVRWESFNPNFYVIFPPQLLENQPHTFLASFTLPEDEGTFIRSLTRQFPGVAFLDVRAILAQAEGILRQLSLGIQYLLGFVLLAGLLVTWALMMASLDARQREQALLKVLGARRGLLAGRQLAEFLLLGGLSGLLAAVLGEGLYALMAGQLFNLPWSAAPLFWVLPPLAGALLLAAFAHLALRPSLQAAPHQLLKRLG
ncbi:ABC transporter permease [Marinospirillum alkaliphilum]|uniref:Putative ABC transport system permease protein n=1 Tax=Marinospirillum alkaliphilum DSM 21637 TaxID=1122209 RepID=A0A1K1V5F7_9GAMM|nr:FtsX-like permease family protein [Marinospirillum alkaliphilum]SFX20004.1 putative ABC transport system permease protein [Marinospirillum alkaliphilum DSM 21637]